MSQPIDLIDGNEGVMKCENVWLNSMSIRYYCQNEPEKVALSCLNDEEKQELSRIIKKLLKVDSCKLGIEYKTIAEVLAK